MTIFLFVITANWIGILPGFNTIGWVEPAHHVAEHAHHIDKDLSQVKLQVFDEVGPVNILMPGSGNDVITAEEWEHCHPGDHKKEGHLILILRNRLTFRQPIVRKKLNMRVFLYPSLEVLILKLTQLLL
ncbi:MAG: hypothetical protein CM1200mP38_5590 [Dehalococcoidia bacterium]|nr:MAG: hypothetical protein CM1200mP38_5590 [Dehalococcoidia bacterium]